MLRVVDYEKNEQLYWQASDIRSGRETGNIGTLLNYNIPIAGVGN